MAEETKYSTVSFAAALQAKEMSGVYEKGESHIIQRKLFLQEPKFVKIVRNSPLFITKRIL